jgi:preprotein translocase subunit SecA
MEYLSDAVDTLIDTHCVSEVRRRMGLDGLVKELKTYWPNDITEAPRRGIDDADDIYDLVMADAKAYYEQRETELTPVVMRDVERQVMLRIIDQRWREHLEEMDYLQEGINLRAMGQKDPLTEWQREGYEMFGQMMKGIAQDFVKYVMHVQVIRKEEPQPVVQNVQLRLQRLRAVRRHRRRARAAAAAGEIPAEAAPAAPAGAEAADRREGRMVEDPAQRALPVRQRQEVQAVPRRNGL